MRTLFLTTALCLLPLAAWAQPMFEYTGKSFADVCNAPEDKAVVSVEGDINKDGLKDLVIAISEVYDDDNFAFYLGQEDGTLTRFRSYAVSLPYGDKTGLSITNAGVVRIQLDRNDGYDVFLYRYEKDDFRLIGGKKDRHVSGHFDESYNYLTGEMNRTDGEGKSRKVSTADLPELPVLNFGWVPLNYDMLAYLHEEPEDGPMDADDILVMGIFRRMQATEMLFWHFCDWENPYHDPYRTEDRIWDAEDSYESPGSYNCYSSLTITKQDDGYYFIEHSTTSVDRSWEAGINEEGSNIDELLEEADYEEETLEEEWFFYDGIFTFG
jgi:hypothetical protein